MKFRPRKFMSFLMLPHPTKFTNFGVMFKNITTALNNLIRALPPDVAAGIIDTALEVFLSSKNFHITIKSKDTFEKCS